MRILHNAFRVGRIAGRGAFGRTLRHGWLLSLAARLDELCALLQFWRARALRRAGKRSVERF